MFNFHLPEDRIASYPVHTRSHSALLEVHRNAPGTLADHNFAKLPDLLQPGDVLVLNNSRVVPARLLLGKPTGGRVELLFERQLTPDVALALLGSSKPLSAGQMLEHPSGRFCVEVGEQRNGAMRQVHLHSQVFANWLELLEAWGQPPLPPYIRRLPEPLDVDRYQTVFARPPGSVAAPTAGLHFDAEVFKQLQLRVVDTTELTLHVGYGTFARPDPHATELHPERFALGQAAVDAILAAKARGGRVIAVGTTSARVLESLKGRLAPQTGETRLCIRPGFRFRIIDGLITNFHLPGTSLLWLVCAFAGEATMEAAYTHALRSNYRFFSYGDAMLIT